LEELIIQAMKKDKEAFTEVILMIQKDLYIIARTRLKNEDDMCDAVQETMIEAYKSIGKLKKIEYFKSWVIRILINKCNKIYKSRHGNMIPFDDTINTCSSEIAEDKLNFDDLVKNLYFDEKIILTLYYSLGYTTKEMSEILKINEGTIRSKISRAKTKLKNQYKGAESI